MGPSAVYLHDYMQNMAGLKEVRLKGTTVLEAPEVAHSMTC